MNLIDNVLLRLDDQITFLHAASPGEVFAAVVEEAPSRNNSKSIAMPRQIAMYLCKSLTHASSWAP